MTNRELLEQLAMDAVSAHDHYDLADNIDITTDEELMEIIEGVKK